MRYVSKNFALLLVGPQKSWGDMDSIVLFITRKKETSRATFDSSDLNLWKRTYAFMYKNKPQGKCQSDLIEK